MKNCVISAEVAQVVWRAAGFFVIKITRSSCGNVFQAVLAPPSIENLAAVRELETAVLPSPRMSPLLGFCCRLSASLAIFVA